MPMSWAVRYLYEGLSLNHTTHIEESRSMLPNTSPLPSGHGFSFRSVWSSIIEASLQIMLRLPNEGGG